MNRGSEGPERAVSAVSRFQPSREGNSAVSQGWDQHSVPPEVGLQEKLDERGDSDDVRPMFLPI